jgi:hypothetical protein
MTFMRLHTSCELCRESIFFEIACTSWAKPGSFNTELRLQALQALQLCQCYYPQTHNLQPFLTTLQNKEQNRRVAAARALGQLGAWCAASDEQDVLSAIPALHAMERYEIETDADPHTFLATQKTLNALLYPDHIMASNGEGDLPEDAATEAIRWIRSKH